MPRIIKPSAALAALALAMTAPPLAIGHHFPFPREFRLRVDTATVTMSVSERIDAGAKSIRTRAAFDRDTDGRIDARERAALQAFLLGRVVRDIALAVDDRAVRLVPMRVALVHAEGRVDDGRPIELAVQFRVPHRAKSAGWPARAERADGTSIALQHGVRGGAKTPPAPVRIEGSGPLVARLNGRILPVPGTVRLPARRALRLRWRQTVPRRGRKPP